MEEKPTQSLLSRFLSGTFFTGIGSISVILSGFIVAFADGLLATVALNLLVILLPVYFLQGLAVIDCFFRRKAFSPVIRTIGYLLLTLVNPLPMLVTGIGVFDLWADFRKPREPEA